MVPVAILLCMCYIFASHACTAWNICLCTLQYLVRAVVLCIAVAGRQFVIRTVNGPVLWCSCNTSMVWETTAITAASLHQEEKIIQIGV